MDTLNGDRFPNGSLASSEAIDDEGGLRAPPGLTGWRKAWWWFDFIILVKLARLRFIAVLIVIGTVITQWDTLAAYYEKWTRSAAEESAAHSDTEYFCPMHPTVVRDNDREKCPICFMPLSKRKKGSASNEPLPPGVVSRVQFTPYRVVLAGLDTSAVDYQGLYKEITAVGYVEFNERAQRTVSARVNGRIDKLFVNETGQIVTQGDELAALYSPELTASLQNLLDARRNGNKVNEQSARVRLERLGISGDQIEDALSADTVSTQLKIRSPISGHVIKKYVREGQYVQEGMPLYDVADLSTVWIQAQIYEDDIVFLPMDGSHQQTAANAVGVTVTATTRAYPDEPFIGTLAFIYPHVDQSTRTVTIRCEVANPEHKLRPGSTATVTLRVPPSKVSAIAAAAKDGAQDQEKLLSDLVLSVPESAVIDTGNQTIVYRQSEPNVFEGVRVRLGPRMVGSEGGAFYPVLNGLVAGERVVTAGSFLVDAETRLNPAAGSIYFGGSGGAKGGTSSTTVRPTTPGDDDDKITAALAKLSEADRRVAVEQQVCPVLPDNQLGSMGAPVKLMIDDQVVFLCCSGCKKQALADPKATLDKIRQLKAEKKGRATFVAGSAISSQSQDVEAEIETALSALAPEDQALARAQRTCPVIKESRLGSMGPPVKVLIDGKPVFLCCEGCKDDALARPQETLSEVARLRKPIEPRLR